MAALAVALLGACERQPPPTTAPAPTTTPAPQQRENEFTMRYGARIIQVFADPSLSAEVDRLFLLFEDLQAEAVEITPNTRLPIGWTTLTFTDDGEHLVVHEPDYDHADPESHTRPDISVSLATLARQRCVLEQVGVPGEAIEFDQHVLVIVGAIERDEVMLMRVESPGGRMTGWRLTPTEGIAEADEIDSIPVYKVLRARPELLDVMLLPSGYLALYSGDQLTTIVNEADEVVWDWTRDGELPRDHDDELGQPLRDDERPRAKPLLEPIE